jgi:predicted murein hydrolase (TIGR00659 family)
VSDPPPPSIWVYLAGTPLFWLTLTILVYLAADAASRATGRHPLANPVLHAIWILGALLAASGTPYAAYFDGAQFIHFLLGPATVALAVPLYEHRRAVRRALLPIAAALLVGAVMAIASTALLAAAFGLPGFLAAALAPKSVTAGVAMGIAEAMGGAPALTAALVIATGVCGAVIVTPLMDALRVTDWRARGFAVGLASHGIGTARAFQVNPVAGVFAAVAMGLNALLTSLLIPLLLS